MPLISHKLKLIFAHVPKTSGATIKSVMLKLDPNCEQIGAYHSPITKELSNKYPEYYKFIIVRTSFKIISSRYRFTYTHKGKYKEPPVGHPSFKEWLLNINDSHIKYGAPGSVCNQHYYYLDDSNKLLVDQIIDYDQLENGIKELNKKTGNKLDLSIVKKSHYYGEYDWKSIYDKETIEIVKNICNFDIDYFKWEIPEI